MGSQVCFKWAESWRLTVVNVMWGKVDEQFTILLFRPGTSNAPFWWLKTEGRHQTWSSSEAETSTPAHKVHEACIIPEVLHTPGFKILWSLIQNGHLLNKLTHLMKLFQDDNVTSILKICLHSCPLVLSAAPDWGLSQLRSGAANWEKCLASSNWAALGLERKCGFWKLNRPWELRSVHPGKGSCENHCMEAICFVPHSYGPGSVSNHTIWQYMVTVIPSNSLLLSFPETMNETLVFPGSGSWN